MTEKYTPEKVAELVAEARALDAADMYETRNWAEDAEGLADRMADALESVYADSLTAQAEHARWQERAEKAHAPTDDEREALSDFLFTVYEHGTQPNALREADAILSFLAAHRTVQGEPNVSNRHETDISAGQMSVQGEPTDAQVTAALLGYYPEVKDQKELQKWGKKAEADRDRLHKAITEALESLDPSTGTGGAMDDARRILRAALDKKGSDDE